MGRFGQFWAAIKSSVIIDKVGKVLLNLILAYLILSGADVVKAKPFIIGILIIKVILDIIGVSTKVKNGKAGLSEELEKEGL